jgi:hypothetical protein
MSSLKQLLKRKDKPAPSQEERAARAREAEEQKTRQEATFAYLSMR